MKSLALVALLVPAVAHAEATLAGDRYVSTSVIAGADHDLYGGFAAEAGHRMERSPVFVRAMIHGGGVATFGDGDGRYVQARAGAELRDCLANGLLCGSAGVDLGLHHGKHVGDAMTVRHDNLVVAPRVAVDVGGKLRLRGAVEAVQHVGAQTSVTGAAATLGFGVAF